MSSLFVAHHFAIPRPPRPELDAAVQQVQLLAPLGRMELNFLQSERLGFVLRGPLRGMHQLRRLRALDRRADVHHVHASTPKFTPVLRLLRRPVVFSVLTGLGPVRRPRWFRMQDRWVRAWLVTDERSAGVLRDWGADEVVVTPAGLDFSRFERTGLAFDPERFVVLAGSAPWTIEHFESKGVDMLLRVVAREPRLRLVMLWRGKHDARIRSRVAALGLGDRVELLTDTVDVNAVLARVHASIVLASRPDVVKAYPHSLLESIAAGKPVLVSRGLPVAELVEAAGAGVVVDTFEDSCLEDALARVLASYDELAECTAAVDLEPFSERRFVDVHRKVYDSLPKRVV